MKRRSDNYLVEYASLTVSQNDYDDIEQTTFNAELRAGTSEECVAGQNFKVGFRRINLKLKLEGWDFAPSTRYGEHTLKITSEAEITYQATQEQGIAKEGEMIASANAVGPKVSRRKSNSKHDHTAQQHSRKHTECTYAVEVTPNGEWRFSSPGGELLDCTLIPHYEELCRVRAVSGANFIQSTFYVYARKRDLEYEHLDRKPKLPGFLQRVNKDKILKALIAKSLHQESDTKSDQKDVILLSKNSDYE